jgi:hypothetical protein
MGRALANKQSEQCRCLLVHVGMAIVAKHLFVESIEGEQCAHICQLQRSGHTPHMHPSSFPLRTKGRQPPTQVCDSVQTWVRKRPQFYVGRAQGEECPNRERVRTTR